MYINWKYIMKELYSKTGDISENKDYTEHNFQTGNKFYSNLVNSAINNLQ